MRRGNVEISVLPNETIIVDLARFGHAARQFQLDENTLNIFIVILAK